MTDGVVMGVRGGSGGPASGTSSNWLRDKPASELTPEELEERQAIIDLGVVGHYEEGPGGERQRVITIEEKQAHNQRIINLYDKRKAAGSPISADFERQVNMARAEEEGRQKTEKAVAGREETWERQGSEWAQLSLEEQREMINRGWTHLQGGALDKALEQIRAERTQAVPYGAEPETATKKTGPAPVTTPEAQEEESMIATEVAEERPTTSPEYHTGLVETSTTAPPRAEMGVAGPPKSARERRRELAQRQAPREGATPVGGFSIGTEQASPFFTKTSTPLARWKSRSRRDMYWANRYGRQNPWGV